MTDDQTEVPAVTWWQCEPRRLARDHAEIGGRFPALKWREERAGSWTGHLPRWPFDRPEPPQLVDLTGVAGLLVQVEYSHAYPMVAPTIYPLDPEPSYLERTDHKWHVSGDGSLCLLQSDSAWTGRDSVVDLLLKAAGWRIEYALMKAGVIEAMTLHGIADDDQLDALVALRGERPPAVLDQPLRDFHDGDVA
jgi:hypothetical protein